MSYLNVIKRIVDSFVPTDVDCDKETLALYVFKAYAEPHRMYHTTVHLHSLYEMLNELRSLVSDVDYRVMCGAILFHDFYYDLSVPDINNVNKSATLALTWVRDNIPEAHDERLEYLNIHNMITGLPLSFESENGFAIDLFHDIDMSILGQPEEEYNNDYAVAIKKEFMSLYSEEEYNKGRRAFLANTLKKDRIFRTGICHGLFDRQARKNMLEEMVSL